MHTKDRREMGDGESKGRPLMRIYNENNENETFRPAHQHYMNGTTDIQELQNVAAKSKTRLPSSLSSCYIPRDRATNIAKA